MPIPFAELDSRFPQFTAEESNDQKIEQLQDYMFLLLENLRFTLGNLDERNINPAGLGEITSPIYARISDVAAGLQTEISVLPGTILAEVAATYETKTAAAGILITAKAYADAAVGEISLFVNDMNGTSSLNVRGGVIELNTNIAEVNGVLHVGGVSQTGYATINLNRYVYLRASSYGDLIFQAGDGGISFSCQGDMDLFPDGDIDLSPGGEVRIHPKDNPARYWKFTNRGIYYCDYDDTIISSVVLE